MKCVTFHLVKQFFANSQEGSHVWQDAYCCSEVAVESFQAAPYHCAPVTS